MVEIKNKGIKNDTRANAQGKWKGILKGLGFTDKELSGDHCPCPICGGKDRFRFTDYKGGGEYFCSGCGPGGGFDLLLQKNDWEFGYAAKQVDMMLGTKIKEVFQPKVDVERRRRDLNTTWKDATDKHLVQDHLESRGIDLGKYHMPDLRGHPGLYMKDSNQRHPAMVALVRNAGGVPISIHRTYIAEKVRKIMPPTETIKGAAIRLGMPEDTLVVGEGIETTLSGVQEFKYPGYACISAIGMEEVSIPGHVERIIILADNDHSFTGQKAAFTLARRLDQKGKFVEVIMISELGYDFNDIATDDSIERWEWHNES